MKNLYILLIAIFISITAFGQAPEGMSYQAVIKDAQNRVLISKKISIQISIIQDSNNGSVVYSETQSLKTNSNGLVSLTIGAGNSQDNFGDIDWAFGSYYIKTEIDPKGGNNYAIKGTSQLLSVPYALHAKTAEGVVGYGKGEKAKDGSKEIDPFFTVSPASTISDVDIADWNSDDVDDADNDPLNEIQDLTPYQTISGTTNWDKDSSDDFSGSFTNLTNVPAGLSDGDDVNDADSNPTNELQDWSNLPGIPADLKSGTLNDNRIASSNITQHEALLTIGNLIGAPIGTVVGNSDAQTLTNKNIDADHNTIVNIANTAIKTGAGIDATKIANGSVNNSEFIQLNGVSSSIVGISDSQTLTNKTINTSSNIIILDAADINSGILADERIAESNVTQHESAISHQNLTGVGVNTHGQIDAHISDLSNPHAVTKTQIGLTDVENIKVNLAAGGPPTSTDDTNEGYSVGSRWIDTVGNEEYVCLDATVGSAIWTATTNSSGSSSQDLDALQAQITALDARIAVLELIQIGDFRDGGVVFYIDETGQHGLVCAIENQGRVRWRAGTLNLVAGATGTAIGEGAANTNAIIEAYEPTEAIYAAGLARAYTGGGFNDWFLPSKDELNQMYVNKDAINTTATTNQGSIFLNEYYWSSTESTSSIWEAWIQLLVNGDQFSSGDKSNDYYNVRAVRAF